ncbi:MAG: bifunctional (p)ppGpp synthetase/guanosine-3',5'-bis(diphosphate) 3'-pyrophosphohydrolase [Alphaproteobacteria bacterium]|jgi:GTP diphosphokinase / guanosine-3',5'-bis(diphosphate) 3'-diphosphatase|nr:bifunctional (p)ppGpp synthetase/guanosine-3',5'-bis(diphosphate) 3'-pyrophosphohydrolase [Alphaproteobacteria bacterium]MBT5389312.1 bifunctional (p)ppGpp synthetase/guanosine-3',5'-bis(diphosphate) 3'-pyrophosphohydrolase [Alphaproteobacteria bacterium]MBT5540713.1 bifunctional (p)ppGpp synthetase/guanosine-3',5'-bis(diphosphate) 3'-pyrophosphohydrolase [Alphaproteobacteria bacterium]
MNQQTELIEKVRSYDPNVDEDLIRRAYDFAQKVHGTQKRDSGENYFSHPLEVANILTRWKLDAATIATALLHDTIEDTVATFSEIEALFGKEVAYLVDGVTKLSRIELQSDKTKQAENFRKLVLAMSKDIRVLLVKLADRLHNMRTLHHRKSEAKRKRTSLETMEIYAPLAERIGMHEMKNELEDLAFAELNPEGRASILSRFEFLRKIGEDIVGTILQGLQDALIKGGIHASISGREKTTYSIWRKMQRKNVEFEQLSDVMAFRIVLDTIPECYQALGIIHSTYLVVPARFKDYISTPKPNGYRSLHTTVIVPDNQRIEIQIRTYEMHEVAELGVAAHWQYKQEVTDTKTGGQYRWLRGLLDILESASGPEEFLEHTKLEMFQDQVFCFTPQGDLITLPKGATPVDFAYAVHSEIGNTCTSVKINGRLMPLRTELTNGDQVEIITSKNHIPSPTWERFVVTGKARAHIRRFIRAKQKVQYFDLGRALLHKTFKDFGISFSDKMLEKAPEALNLESVEELLIQVGEGQLSSSEVIHVIFPEKKLKEMHTETENTVPVSQADTSIPIKGLLPGMALHYASCCHPIPGDRIVGIATTGSGVTIHTTDCETLENFEDEPERWIDVVWNENMTAEEPHAARVKVTLINESGSLGKLATVIGKNGSNILNLKIVQRNTEFFDLFLDIEVKDLAHLTNIIAALRAIELVNSVERV